MMKQFNSLAIDVSNRCNLSCTYCFEKREDNTEITSMNTLAIYNGIDFFLENLIPDNIKDLHFHFGRREPLMAIPFLNDVVDYLDKKGQEQNFTPHFHITTNGTCFNPEINRFLKNHDFDIRVSLDGFSEIHNKNRVFGDGSGSFNTIIHNLEALKKDNIPFTINSVYYPHISFSEVYNFFRSIGAERVDFFPLWIHNSKAEGFFEYEDICKMKKEIEDLIDNHIKIGNGLFESTRIVQIETYLQCLCGFKHSSFYCGAGRNYIGISGDGKYYPCLKFINTSQWLLGDYERGINHSSLKRFFQNGAPPVSKLQFCHNCEIRNLCTGFCYVDRINLENYYKSRFFYCFFQKTLFKAAESLYDAFKETKPSAIVRMAGFQDILFNDLGEI